jgi:chromodomain-helicase-DNA-binding protein 1
MRSTRGACEAAKYVEIDSEADEAEAVEFAAPIKRVIVKKSTNAFKSKNAEQTVKRGTPDRTDLVNDDDDDDDDDLFDSEEEQEAVKKNKLTTGARAAARKSATAARDIKANVRLPERHLKREKNNVSIEIKSTRAKKADKVREFKDADRKSIRQRVGNDVLYAEVDSEEEFVKENIDFLHSDDDDLSKASGYSHSGSSKSDDAVVYRIEAILATRSLTAMNWRAVCGYMSTREVTRGSVWLQPEEEYASMTEDLVTKYLIKWEHASYLHVSWETEKDLEDMSESNVKAILKRFSKKYVDPFSLVETREKLVPNSYDLLPVSYLTVERILDVEDESIDISTMPHATAILPYEDTLTMDTDDESVFLHGTECFVVVKWEGIGYSDLSFESVHDLRGANIPYEAQLRQFYRREQRCLDLKRGKLTGRVDVSLLQMEAPPLFPGGRTLRDYQWDGVKWLLFNWTQKRNSILADEVLFSLLISIHL